MTRLIEESKAVAIANSYALNNDIAKEHLAYLMHFEEIDTLVYRVYTPAFNDGDPCEFTVDFIGKPNCLYEYDYVFLDGDSFETTEHAEDLDENALEKIPAEHVTTLQMPWPGYGDKEALDNFYELREKLYPKYKLENFEEALQAIAEIILKPNTQGLIKLEGDTVEIISESYDCGY